MGPVLMDEFNVVPCSAEGDVVNAVYFLLHNFSYHTVVSLVPICCHYWWHGSLWTSIKGLFVHLLAAFEKHTVIGKQSVHYVWIKWLKYPKWLKLLFQLFKIIQVNGWNIQKSWNSWLPIELVLVPLIKGLKIGKEWNPRISSFSIISVISVWNDQTS